MKRFRFRLSWCLWLVALAAMFFGGMRYERRRAEVEHVAASVNSTRPFVFYRTYVPSHRVKAGPGAKP